jgi:hypothetical protein
VNIEITVADGLQNRVLTALRSGPPPDLIDINCGWNIPYALTGEPLAIDDFVQQQKIDLADFLPAPLATARVGGKLMGLPYRMEGHGFIYNRGAYKAAGLDPDKPPRTWDELVEYSKRTRKTGDGKQRCGLGVCGGGEVGNVIFRGECSASATETAFARAALLARVRHDRPRRNASLWDRRGQLGRLDAARGTRYRDIAMARYVTTNLRLPAETYRELRYQAARRGTTLAAVVREAVARHLGRADEGAPLAVGEDPADAMIGSVGAPVADEAVNHDHYLYGWPRETEDEAPGRHERAARPGATERRVPSRRRRVPATKPAGALRADGADPLGSRDSRPRPRRGRAGRRDRA